MPTRHQLTLFVPPHAAVPIEAVRRAADPVQHGLIAAHVTLGREDELPDLSELEARLAAAPPPLLTLTFGRAEAFGGHGLLLPCTAGATDFQRLRHQVLGPAPVRDHTAHLTLAHPRNPRAPGNGPAAALALPASPDVTFREISLIEQVGRTAWRRLWSVPLSGGA
jgi:2'-5' RNA ligase